MTLKHIYMVKRSSCIYSVKNFLPYPIQDITITLYLCRYNVLILFHEIMRSNRQTFLIGSNKPPHGGQESTLINIVRSVPKGVLMTLKHIYKFKRSSYLYSVRNFLPLFDIRYYRMCAFSTIHYFSIVKVLLTFR